MRKYFTEKSIRILLIALIFIEILLFNDIRNYIFTYIKSLGELGTLGDFIGGFIGTLAAIIAVIFSYQLNKKQFEQFEEQALQFKEQALQFAKQSSQTDKQLFENNFFQLINMFNQKISTLEISGIKADKSYELVLANLKQHTDAYGAPEDIINYILAFDRHIKGFQTEYSILILNYNTILSYIDKGRGGVENSILNSN